MQHWHAILIALAIVGAGWLARPPTYAPIPAEGPAHARCAAMFYGAGGPWGTTVFSTHARAKLRRATRAARTGYRVRHIVLAA